MAAEFKLSEACCSVPAVQASYVSKGKTEHIGTLPVYFAGPAAEKVTSCLVLIYDIFGLHPNAYQVTDLLQSQLQARGVHTLVVMPDWFRGWNPGPMPTPNTPEQQAWRQNMHKWIGENATWEKLVHDFEHLKNHIKEKYNVTEFGTIGFCWGAKIALAAAKHKDLGVVGSALVHPSAVTVETMKDVDVPICALPSKNEEDFIPIMATLKDKPCWSRCYHERFDDMQHGWCGSRGDWKDENIAARATHAIQLVVNFANDVLH
jgi:carboxymethylenebutenolidase